MYNASRRVSWTQPVRQMLFALCLAKIVPAPAATESHDISTARGAGASGGGGWRLWRSSVVPHWRGILAQGRPRYPRWVCSCFEQLAKGSEPNGNRFH
jgi:hypothetical protein